MVRKIFIGDKVMTQFGQGVVVDAQSWREKILDMNDYEAVEFSDRCRVECGLDYKDRWVELLVSVGGRMKRFLGHQVTVLEGRDDKQKGHCFGSFKTR